MGRHPGEMFQRLSAFFDACPDGLTLSYEQIAEQSGVPMDTRGKGCMRRVLNWHDREYLCTHGEGITLADHRYTVPVLSEKTVRVDRAIERTNTCYHNTSRFFGQLTPDELKQALFLGSVLGAWSATASMLSRTYAPRQRRELSE